MSAAYRPYRDEDGLDGLDSDNLAWADHEPGTIQIYEKTTEALPFSSNRRLLMGTITLALMTLLLGFLVGFFAHSNHSDCVPTISVALHSVKDEDTTIVDKILRNIDEKTIKSVVREFSRSPRMPGTSNDLRLAKQVYDFFHAHSFDKVEFKNYTVLLSLPDEHDPNFVEIIDGNKIIFTSFRTNDENFKTEYCAYSPDGDVEGDVVFVNYGSLDDYRWLQNTYNISFASKIVIAKQFHLTADEQAQIAHQIGAAALLLYPDPEQYNPPKLNATPYPRSLWMPPDAVRRDSLLWNGLGDPLTPGYPATHYAFRLPLSSVSLPAIPVQPISYSTAYEILRMLGGKAAPNKWQGGFNFTYHVGPGFDRSNFKLHLKINNKLVNKTIHNVIGYIRGGVEPDRYVLIGNHRDAWVNGAIDSASGTGALLELSRVFGDLLKKDKWRPRRTIMFCSFGAEEFNLIGSTEWIEENMKRLQGRAVAYVNADIIVVGNGSVSVAASPLLYHAIFNATKQVPNPNYEEDTKTVYEKWIVNFPLMRNSSDMIFNEAHSSFNDAHSSFNDDNNFGNMEIEKNWNDLTSINRRQHFKYEEPNEPGFILNSFMESAMQEVRPRVRQLDMRSVYAPFFALAGIPVVEVVYTHSTDENKESILPLTSYPLMHTQYDNVDMIEKFIDPQFKYHKAVTQVLGEIVRDLADSLFIPFNLLDYSQVLKDFYLNLQIHAESLLLKNGVKIDMLHSAIHNFSMAAINFHNKQDKIDFKDPMAIRRVNDQLLLLERSFLDQNGLPRNVMKRHIVLTPSETNSPYDEMFPGLMDEFSNLLAHTGDFGKSTWSWDVIKAHFSILIFTIQSAADMISDVV